MGPEAKYEDVSWIPCGSVVVERLFSAAKLVYSPLRQSMLPITLEMIMFLKANRWLWDVNTVAEVMSKKEFDGEGLYVDEEEE